MMTLTMETIWDRLGDSELHDNTVSITSQQFLANIVGNNLTSTRQ